MTAGGPRRQQCDQERRYARIIKAEAALNKLVDTKRRHPDAQRIVSQAGRTLQRLKNHKDFTYRVGDSGILGWRHKTETIAAQSSRVGWYLLPTGCTPAASKP